MLTYSLLRPYVALFEQALLGQAQIVVNSFFGSAKTRYGNALNTLRMPYWYVAYRPCMSRFVDC